MTTLKLLQYIFSTVWELESSIPYINNFLRFRNFLASSRKLIYAKCIFEILFGVVERSITAILKNTRSKSFGKPYSGN